MKDKNTAWLLFVALCLIWGSSFFLIKKGLLSLTPIQLACLRITSAGVFLLPPAIKNLKLITKHNVGYLFISGFVGSFLPSLLFATAQQVVPSSITGVMNALTPLFIALIASMWFGFTLSRKVLLGLVLGFVGTIILAVKTSATISGTDIPYGYISLVVLACVCYAVNLNLVKYKLKDTSSVAISSISLLFVLVPAVIILLFSGITSLSLTYEVQKSLAATLILGVLATGFALLLFNKLLKVSTPTFSGAIAYVIPVVAIFFGVLDGEQLYFLQFVGIGMILIGLLLISL